MRAFSILFLCVTLFVLSGCKSKPETPSTPEAPAEWQSPPQAITLMAFNVENLFDTEDDPKKSDETFLPLSKKGTPRHLKLCEKYRSEKWREECRTFDWSEEVLKLKLERLGKVIRSVKSGQGPDILVLEEVENKGILERLVKEQWGGLDGKQVILIEGPDQRGIDVAMVSRLPLLGKPRLRRIPFHSISHDQKIDTRPILQARFKLPDGKPLTVFGVHFPAPFHPFALRIQALQYLNQLRQEVGKDEMVIAAGDFNIPREEDNKERLLERFTQVDWVVAHKWACGTCNGTTYYAPKKSWSFLDMIFLSKNFYDGLQGWKAVKESFRIVNRAELEQMTKEGFPNSFEPNTKSGVSDHWPLAIDLVPTEGP